MAATEVDSAIPRFAMKGMTPAGPEAPEAEAWRRLQAAIDAEYYAAESTLALAIFNLYDILSPEGQKPDPQEDNPFTARGFKVGDKAYIVDEDPAQSEGETVVVIRPDRIVSLSIGG